MIGDDQWRACNWRRRHGPPRPRGPRVRSILRCTRTGTIRSMLNLMEAHQPAGRRRSPADHASVRDQCRRLRAEAGGACRSRPATTPVRHAFVMVRPTSRTCPHSALPDGLEIRPVRREHRAARSGQRAPRRSGTRWGSAEPVEADYEQLLTDPLTSQTDLWHVAWDGDQVAGQVRAFINEGDERGARPDDARSATPRSSGSSRRQRARAGAIGCTTRPPSRACGSPRRLARRHRASRSPQLDQMLVDEAALGRSRERSPTRPTPPSAVPYLTEHRDARRAPGRRPAGQARQPAAMIADAEERLRGSEPASRLDRRTDEVRRAGRPPHRRRDRRQLPLGRPRRDEHRARSSRR